jgi:hypothetical protein
VDELATKAVRAEASVIIIGVSHDNVRLSDELLEFLKLVRVSEKFDCLFVEDPTDLQDEFDRAVNYRPMRVPFLWVFRKLGYTSELDQAYVHPVPLESLKSRQPQHSRSGPDGQPIESSQLERGSYETFSAQWIVDVT